MPDRECEAPKIVGILNVTPDSFSDGGRFSSGQEAVAEGERLFAEGAHVVEVGGESTRPGAPPVSLQEELDRVIPVVEGLAGRAGTVGLVAVDTAKAAVAAEALAAGARCINDVTAGQGDESMLPMLAASDCSIVLMHMKGTPRTMQDRPMYDDVTAEIAAFFRRRMDDCRAVGIDGSRLILDPGIGFGKRVSDNLRLIRELQRFQDLGCPVMIGVSRKSFIGRVTGRTVETREYGTCAAHCLALLNGAQYLRVHDVGAARDVSAMVSAIQSVSEAFDAAPVPGGS